MARHLRMEYEGAVYHITSRGNERSDVFDDPRDKQRFLEKLAETAELHRVRIYAYVIMSNHYHLLLKTPFGNLSRFMQQLNTSYTMYYNAMQGRVGHVFSGRYKAKVVDSDEYLLALTRYIHLNPVKIKAMKDLPLDRRLSELRGYRWSSYPGYAGLSRREKMVDYGPLSEIAGSFAAERREGYRQLVESGLAEDDDELKEILTRSSKAIGGKRFCRQVELEYKLAAAEKGSGTDVSGRRLEAGEDADDLLQAVSAAFGVDLAMLRKRRNVSDARLAAAWLLRECTTLTARDAGRKLGLADGSGLTNLLSLAEQRMSESRKMKRVVRKLGGKI